MVQYEKRLDEHEQKIDFFVRTSLPPVEGIFYDGQIFDSYVFVADLIKSATNRIILIDNYILFNLISRSITVNIARSRSFRHRNTTTAV